MRDMRHDTSQIGAFVYIFYLTQYHLINMPVAMAMGYELHCIT